MPFDEFTESQSFVQFPNHNQAAIGGDPRSLKADPQETIERQLKSLFLVLTHWVYASKHCR